MRLLLGILCSCIPIKAQVHLPPQLFASSSAVASNGTCDPSIEFFDQSALQCSPCVIANGAATQSNAWLIPDKNNAEIAGLATVCTCNQDAIRTRRKESTCESIWPVPCSLETCTPCPSDRVPSRDLSRCMACGNTTLGIEELSRECKCAANSIVRERNESGIFLDVKECVECMGNTVADLSTNTCKVCSDSLMVVGDEDYVCTCPKDYQLVMSKFMSAEKCVENSHISSINSKVAIMNANEMIFSSFSKEETKSSDSVVSVTSALLDDMFLSVTTRCYYYQSEIDIVSCQALGNLCVLQHFESTVPPCAVFDLIQRSGRSSIVNTINGWFATLPFLSYRSVASSAVQTSAFMKMSFDAESNEGTSDHLDFVLASYYLNGTLIGFKPLANELLYCQMDKSVADSPSWTQFGVSALFEYFCNLEALQTTTVIFHELYMINSTKISQKEDGGYIPIPIKNLNYRDASGVYVNQDSDVGNDYFSHRFFLFDFLSGVPVGETLPDAVRYVSAITLTIKTASDPQYIEIPELTVAYIDTKSPKVVPVSFSVVYTSSTDELWAFAKALFTIGCILGGLQTMLQTFNWYRRSTQNEVVENAMCQILSTIIRYAAVNFAPLSFTVMFVMCSYVFIVSRLQSRTLLMLPDVHSDTFADGIEKYSTFRVLLPVVFFCQFISVFCRVYRQAHLQLFFVDWERPRATVMDIDTGEPIHAPISAWRMILVVNEWNKMQTVRKTSLRLTLLCILFLLYGCNLKRLALPAPRAQMEHFTTTATAESYFNPYLRFANVAMWWLLIYVCQRLWKWMIFERYIDEPREQLFIDLCTVAKVSCLFLDEAYHGFYLHCRSPHPFADGSMGELVDQLKQEEAGLTAGRHLDSTFPDCQTFEIFVTRKWKRKFNTLYSLVRGENFLAGPESSGEGLIKRSISSKRPDSRSTDFKRSNGSVTSEDRVRNAEQLRNFLQSFIENQNERFRWRIYRAHTCLTRHLDIPPDMSFSRQSLFLPDMQSKFAKASLLLGIEHDLMLLDVLCFCLCDLWFNNHAVSALVTYALQIALLAMRAHVGKRNIAKSSLVDYRFLI